jgi:hypothetical protein
VKASAFSSWFDGAVRVCPEEKTGAKLLKIMEIIAKPSTGSADIGLV